MSDKLNLIDTIAKQDKFSTFTRLMASSGTTAVIAGAGNFTVFAPTNDAFAKVPEQKLNELLNEVEQKTLKFLLSYHIVAEKVMAANLGSAPTRRAFNGEELTFTDVGGLKVNGAAVQARNMEATNGVVHAVEAVLAPFSTSTFSRASAAAAAVAPTQSGFAIAAEAPASVIKAERFAITGAPPTTQRLNTPAATAPIGTKTIS